MPSKVEETATAQHSAITPGQQSKTFTSIPLTTENFSRHLLKVSSFFLFLLPVLLYSTSYAAVSMQEQTADWLLAKKSIAVSCVPVNKSQEKKSAPAPVSSQPGCHAASAATLLCVFTTRKQKCITEIQS